MSRFVLTAQLQLAAPTNVASVVNQMQQQLGNVTANVQVTGAKAATKQVKTLGNQMKAAQSTAHQLGKTMAQSFKRFAAFSVATRIIGAFTSGLSEAVGAAISFEREMIKISQVTGKTMGDLKSLSDTITELSTSLGVSSQKLVEVSRILSQAGMSARETEQALGTLARTTLAATFDDITQTAEGAVAIFNQFGRGAAALEEQLGAINAVAGQFAVEAGDLIAVIRRTGGVFKAAGGDLNELIALFTSVRATTRESAESIATGLRTIFTRIQRPQTIEYLKQFGVELETLDGKFVGPYEAVRRLSQALAGLEQGDLTFVQIAEQLGGFRQIGKVIPLLQEFGVSQEALNAAMEGGSSLADDAATAQQALAVQITKVKEEFAAMMRGIVTSKGFQSMVKSALSLASAFIKILDALKEVIPLLAMMGTMKAFSMMKGFAGGMMSGMKGPMGKFNRGGMVPGSGNRDTVPALLTPGEFVIRKDSVKSIGAGNLADMNARGYNRGGKIPGVQYYKFGTRKPGVQGATGAATAGALGAMPTPGASSQVIRSTYKSGDRKGQQFFYQEGNAQIGLIEGINEQYEAAMKADGEDIYAAAFLRVAPQSMKMVGNIKNPELTKQNIAAKVKKFQKDAAEVNLGSQAIQEMGEVNSSILKEKFFIQGGTLGQDESQKAEAGILEGVMQGISSATAAIFPTIAPGLKPMNAGEAAALLKQTNIDNVIGNIFEGALINAGGASPYDPDRATANDTFDFPAGLGGLSKNFLGLTKPGIPTDAKATFNQGSMTSLGKKAEAYEVKKSERILSNIFTAASARLDQAQTRQRGMNRGGGVSGSDTVPAMLTPGEFVVSKKAAQSIGYGKLDKMNRKGVEGYASGGMVGGPRKFFFGGRQSGGGAAGGAAPAINTGPVQTSMAALAEAATKVSYQLETLKSVLTDATAKFGVADDKFLGTVNSAANDLATGLKNSGKRIKQMTEGLSGKLIGPAIKFETEVTEGAVKLGTLDETVKADMSAAVDKFASALTEAGTKIGALDEHLKAELEKGAQKLSGGMTDASKIGTIDDILKEMLTKGASAFNTAIMNASAGISAVDDVLKALMTKAIKPLYTAIANASAGISSLDDMMRAELQAAMKPFRTSLAGAGAGMKGSGGTAVLAEQATKLAGRMTEAIHPITAMKNRIIQFTAVLEQLIGSAQMEAVEHKQTSAGLNQLQAADERLEAETKREAQELQQSHPGVQGAAKGGMVKGGGGGGQGAMMGMMAVEMMLSSLTMGLEESTEGVGYWMTTISESIMPITMVMMALSMFSDKLINSGTLIAAALVAAATVMKDHAVKQKEAAIEAMNLAEAQKHTVAEGKAGIAQMAAVAAMLGIMATTGLHVIRTNRFKAKQAHKDTIAEQTNTAAVNTNTGAINRNSGAQMGAAAKGTGGAMAMAGSGAGRAAGGAAAAGPKNMLGMIMNPLLIVGALFLVIASQMEIFSDMFKVIRDTLSSWTGGLVASSAVMEAETTIAVKKKVAEEANEKQAKQLKDAMKELEEGTKSAAQLLHELEFGGVGADIDVSGAQNALQRQKIADSKSSKLENFLGIFAGPDVFGRQAAAEEAMNKNNDEMRKSIVKSLSEGMTPLVTNQAKAMAFATGGAGNKEDFMRNIESSGAFRMLEQKKAEAQARGDTGMVEAIEQSQDELRDKYAQMFDNINKEAARSVERLKAMNLGLRGLEAASAAAGMRVQNFATGLEVGHSALEQSFNTVSAALQTAGGAMTGAEFDKAFANVEAQLQSLNIGGAEISRFTNQIKGMAHVQRNFASMFSDDFKKNLVAAGGAGDLSAQGLLDTLGDQIGNSMRGAGFDETVIKEIQAQFRGAKLSDEDFQKILGGDFSVVTDKLGDMNSNLQEKLQTMMQERIAAEKAIIDVTKREIAAREKMIDAQRKAIDMQLEAAEIIAKAGGPQVTPAMRRQAIIASANAGSGAAGIGDMRNAGLGSLRSRRNQISAGLFATESTLQTEGGRAGAEGVKTDARQKALQKELNNYAKTVKELIKVSQDELKIVQKKNELEKQSLQALISGDMEKFLTDQAAVGATAAVSLGDQQLASLFGADALGQAFQNIEKMSEAGVRDVFGLDIAEAKQRAAGLALSARGVEDPRMAAMLAGQTTEEQALRDQQIGLAKELAAAGQEMSNFAQMQVQSAEINVQNAKIAATPTNPNEPVVTPGGFARGGVVYASNGMFVPRGTDTVPAMLTPGEFVVNRGAVQRGNNLQLLKAMNNGGGGAQGYARGGVVYAANGGSIQPGGGMLGIDPAMVTNLTNSLNQFNSDLAANIAKLQNMKFRVKLDTANVNVNLNGGGFLSELKDNIKNELMQEVGEKIKTLEFDQSGRAKFGGGFLRNRN